MYENVFSFGIWIKYGLLVLFVFIITQMLEHLWIKRRLYMMSMKVQGPLTIPFIGSGYLFLRRYSGKFSFPIIHFLNYMKIVDWLHEKYPKLFRIWLGPILVYIVSEPDHIAKILNSPHAIEKFEVYDIITEIFGHGLVSAPAKVWKVHRKAINPSFNKSIILSFVPIFAKNSSQFASFVKEFIGKKDVDWVNLSKRYSLQTACETLMGVDANLMHTGPRGEDLGDCIKNLLCLGVKRTVQVWNNVEVIYKYSKLKKEFDYFNKIYDKISKWIIKEKLKQIENNEINSSEIEAENKRKDLLSFMLQDSIFTENQTLYEVKTMVAAATDTIGTTIITTFIMLAMFPDEQEKIYKEVASVVGLDRNINASNLGKLIYTEKVIKETMRLFPPAVLFGRKLTEDINLDEATLPKGGSVLFIPYLTHRNPKYWEDPLRFNPDRFSPEQISSRNAYTYLPFSHGSRNCIGWYYGLLNLKTIVPTVIRDYKVFTSYKRVEDVEFNLELVLTLIQGANIWFEPRI